MKSQKCGKSPLTILDENKSKTTMMVYQIFAKEDKCQVQKDNHEERENKIFLRKDKLDQRQKKKGQST